MRRKIRPYSSAFRGARLVSLLRHEAVLKAIKARDSAGARAAVEILPSEAMQDFIALWTNQTKPTAD